MGPELAAVYVSVLPSTSQIADGMVKGVEAAGPRVDTATRGIWDRMSSGMVAGLKVGAVAAGVGVAAAVTTAVSSGFERLVTIDTARSKLGALGHDAASVQGIMDNALASVKGTAFGLGDAATAASSAVAAGIPAGQELEKYLKSVGDTAAIAGVEFSDMGSIFNQVQSGQKAYTAELNQLRDRGLPIYQWIAEEAGVTAGEVSKMASEGQISSELFFSAIDKNVGGAAGVMGQTSFVGAWDNLWAAVSRVGAAFLDAGGEGGGFFSQLKPLLGDATSMLDAITPKAEELGVAFGGFVAGAVAWIRELSTTLDFSSWDAFLASLGGGSGALSSIGASITTLTPAFQEFGAQMPEIGSSMVTLFTSVVPLVAGALGFLADNVDTIIQWMPALVAGFVAWRVASSAFTAAQVAQAPVLLASNTLGLSRALIDMQVARSTAAATTAQVANTAATNGGLLANVRATAALIAQRVAMVATSVATKAAAAAQWLMNAAMSANPIMLVVLAIAALIAGLVWFFTQTELGQAIWTEFTRFLGEAWNNIVAVATTVFTFLGEFFTNVWNGIVTVVQFVWGLIVGYITWYINTVMTIITTVVTAIVTAWNWLWNGIVTVFQFVWDLIVLAVTTYINIVMTVITTVLNVITTVWANIWNGISTVISTVWGWIVAGVTGYINLVRTVITNVVNAISSTWNTVWGAISAFFMGLWVGIVSGVTGFVREVQFKVDEAMAFIGSIPQRIGDFFSGIGEWLVESGKSLIQGFLDGISSAFEGAKGFVEDGLAGIRDLFPFSPAKEGPFSGRGWVAYSGMSVGETFGQSVASALNSEKSGVASALGGIQSEFDSFDGSATASLGVDRFGDVAFARNAQRASYDFAAGEAQFGGGGTTINQTVIAPDGPSAETIGHIAANDLEFTLGLAGG